MSTNGNGRIPQRVALLFHKVGDGRSTLRSIKYGGPIFPAVPGHGPRIDLNTAPGLIDVEGTLYAHERRIGERWTDYRTLYHGHEYRRLEGWQVLTTYPDMSVVPDYPIPVDDRGKAETFMRQLVTDNLAVYGTKLRSELVWQDGLTYSDPVAVCDAHDHTRAEAVQARLDRRYLPLRVLEEQPPPEHEKAGEAPTSPANGETMTDPATFHPDDTTILVSGQARLVVRYDSAVLPSNLAGQGQLVEFEVNGQKRPTAKTDIWSTSYARRWLLDNGYRPDYAAWRWLDRGDFPRRRLEVHQLAAAPQPYTETANGPVDHAYLRSRLSDDEEVTDEMRQRWIAKGRADKIARGLDPDLPVTLQRENYGVDPQGVPQDHAMRAYRRY